MLVRPNGNMDWNKSLYCLFLIQLTIQFSAAQQPTFRNDYIYLDETESFYKVHTDPQKWRDAKKICASEGVSLFYPEDASEARAVINLLQRRHSNYNWVYVGISDTLVSGVYETVDGRRTENVFNKWAAGKPDEEGCAILHTNGLLDSASCERRYPFICKKSVDTPWNTECDVPNMDYKYDKKLGKCYKFHVNPLNWHDALAKCKAELSYLAVLNSQAESEHLVQLIENADKDNVPSLQLSGAVHMGYHNLDGDDWKTIRGTSLANSGFGQWPYGEPNGGDQERCGSMYYTGQLNDIGCSVRMFFICEHEVRGDNNFTPPRNS